MGSGLAGSLPFPAKARALPKEKVRDAAAIRNGQATTSSGVSPSLL